jgi:sugar/nucleoside kinase (ribokinase family)
VFADFQPKLLNAHRAARFVFLANGMPSIQMDALAQVPGRRLAVADTMDLWINHYRRDLDALLGQIDGLVINDIEARLLTGTENLVAAGRAVQRMGPKFVVIKKGEHGAMFFGEHETYVLPAFPTEQLVDPTGAGDTFAGGFMGYVAKQDAFDAETLKTAMAYGIVAASFNVEGFGIERMAEVTSDDIERRMAEYRQMLSF